MSQEPFSCVLESHRRGVGHRLLGTVIPTDVLGRLVAGASWRVRLLNHNSHATQRKDPRKVLSSGHCALDPCSDTEPRKCSIHPSPTLRPRVWCPQWMAVPNSINVIKTTPYSYAQRPT